MACAEKQALPKELPPLTLDGRVVSSGDGDFEDWRTGLVWQARKPDRAPQMIVRANSSAAVQDAVRYAKQHDLKVAIKSSGHHVWGNFLRDGGMLIDLWPLRDVRLNDDLTASIEPAAWSQQIMDVLAKDGRSFPAAHCASVGMGGFLLGGGIGHNWDNWGGLSAYSIDSADVVLADGSARTISDETDPDLMWALRGAGNGFPAVVTRFKIKTYEAAKVLRASSYFFPLSKAPDAMAWADRLIRSGNLKHTEPLVIMAHNPIAPANAVGADAKVCLVRFNVFAPDEKSANDVLNFVESDPSKPDPAMVIANEAWTIQDSFYTTLDFRNPLNFGHFGVDNIWTTRPGDVVPVLANWFAKAPTPACHIVMSPTAEPWQPENACAAIGGTLYIGCYSVGSTAEEGARAIEWLRGMSRDLQPYASGRYINEIDVGNTPEAESTCYSGGDWERLQRVRNTYDPDGLFFDFIRSA